ncbi:hypothetical protein ACFQ1M_08400 [Sungkyunkwania multivorans]|uniref:Prepilin type IV endopeptidase peptidase domain-containing protein n=1 Tax=Sungkyunkwania multivorans TaxID=1173618 RepID=A0ABW3CWT7_9FLAO
MIIALKIALLGCLALITLQDLKERMVHWFLFPIAAAFFGLLHFLEVGKVQFLLNLGMNLLLVIIIVTILWYYAKLRMKKNFSDTFGLGDVLMFIALGFSFATISFITFFVFAIFFALIVHLVLKNSMKQPTVPLAGYVALFFSFVLIGVWTGITNNPYLI